MNIHALITKSAFTVAVIAANLAIFSTGDAEARGGGPRGFSGVVRDHRTFSPPPLASANTTVRHPSVVRGCSTGRWCGTTGANGGVVVTPRGQGPRFPRRR